MVNSVMGKTIFDVCDIHELRLAREAEYASMPAEQAHILHVKRADIEWNEILKIREIINNYYKCPNTLSIQPDKLPPPKYNH